MIEVAQATVSIIPTMQGVQAEIKKGFGEPAEQEGESAGKSAGNKFVSAFKSVVTAAAIGKFISTTLNAGAALEQSVGGVETLFGDAADTVTAYADEAYKNAGVSANTYMENVTSFSATLIKGLGNDTAAAAEYANTAMVDMSDNANKFGTDIESIQNAYQGFAKQNYTMLDNLKLGYGGTASEMARLINESGVLGDTVEVTAETVNDVSFDKIIEAIHTVQSDLGITGATAEEASTTFSGSLASMKAAGENLLANLSLGEDIGPSLNALSETVQTFVVGNLFPMLCNILTGLPGVLPSLVTGTITVLGQLAEQMPSLLSGLFTSIGQATANLLSELGLDSWAEAFSETWNSLGETISFISQRVQGFIEDIGAGSASMESFKELIADVVVKLSEFGTELYENVGQAITDTLSEMGLDSAAETFSAAWTALGEAISTVYQTLQDFFTWLDSGLASAELFKAAIMGLVAGFIAWKASMAISDVISGVSTAIQTAKGAFAAFNAVLSANPIAVVVTLLASLVAAIVYLWNNCEEFREGCIALWEAVKNAFQDFGNAASETLDSIGSWMNDCKETIIDVWNAITEAISSAWESIKAAVSSAVNSVKTTVSTVFDTIKTTASDVWNNIKSTISSVVEGVRSTVSSVFESVKSKVESIWEGIKSAISNPIESAKATVKSALDSISSFFSSCKLSLPSIKLPHFSLTGSFSISPPSVPHVSVSWYKEGGILTQPTIFGALGNNLLAGGEAGQEAVLPLKSFYDKLETIVGGQSIGISLEINIDHFDNSSQQDVKDFAQRVAEEIQSAIDRRKEAVAF